MSRPYLPRTFHGRLTTWGRISATTDPWSCSLGAGNISLGAGNDSPSFPRKSPSSCCSLINVLSTSMTQSLTPSAGLSRCVHTSCSVRPDTRPSLRNVNPRPTTSPSSAPVLWNHSCKVLNAWNWCSEFTQRSQVTSNNHMATQDRSDTGWHSNVEETHDNSPLTSEMWPKVRHWTLPSGGSVSCTILLFKFLQSNSRFPAKTT